MYTHMCVCLPPTSPHPPISLPSNLTPPSYLPPFQSHSTLLSPSLPISPYPPILLPSNFKPALLSPPLHPHPTLLSTSHPTSPYPPTNSLSSPLIQAYGGVDTRVSMVKGSARVVTYAIVRYSEPHVHVHEWVCIVLYVCTVCVYCTVCMHSVCVCTYCEVQ